MRQRIPAHGRAGRERSTVWRARCSRRFAPGDIGHPAPIADTHFLVAARIPQAAHHCANSSTNPGAAVRAVAICSFGIGVGIVVSSSASGSSYSFSPGRQAGDHDPHSSRADAGKRDQVARQIDDLHRLSHVEDEDLPLAPISPPAARAARFGNRHEVARHFGMRHRHRAARGDLLAEAIDDAAGAAQARCRSGRRRTCGRASPFSDWQPISASRFDAPMMLTGLTALSVDTEHELRHAGSRRPRAQDQRAQNSCCALLRIPLFTSIIGHMLVRSGVEQHARVSGRR
jgi:hypothetical protein